MNYRAVLIKLNWLLASQFGLDPRRFFRSIRGIPRFLRDWRKFRAACSDKVILVPCLHDWYEEGGVTKSEYFWQDLLVAKKIFETNPGIHVDVGSRVDGFVAHVASFREIEVFDVRQITTQVPGITFKQVDLMSSGSDLPENYCDSVSCLHAVEHFGLGRYGDPVNPRGHEQGISNMGKMLKSGGCLYLATPIGVERVEFNANRVFDPKTIIQCAEFNGLQLQELTVIDNTGIAKLMELDDETFLELALKQYNLGLFVFIKPGSSNM